MKRLRGLNFDRNRFIIGTHVKEESKKMPKFIDACEKYSSFEFPDSSHY